MVSLGFSYFYDVIVCITKNCELSYVDCSYVAIDESGTGLSSDTRMFGWIVSLGFPLKGHISLSISLDNFLSMSG